MCVATINLINMIHVFDLLNMIIIRTGVRTNWGANRKFIVFYAESLCRLSHSVS